MNRQQEGSAVARLRPRCSSRWARLDARMRPRAGGSLVRLGKVKEVCLRRGDGLSALPSTRRTDDFDLESPEHCRAAFRGGLPDRDPRSAKRVSRQPGRTLDDSVIRRLDSLNHRGICGFNRDR